MIISLFKVDNDQRILSPFKPRTGTRPETPSDPWSSQIQPSRSSHTSFHATFSKMLSSTERNREKNPFTCTRITLPRDFTSHVLSTLSTTTSDLEKEEKKLTCVKKGEKRRKGEGKTEAKFKPKWIREKRFEFEIQIQQRFTETRGRRDWCRFWRKETSWDREKGE